MGRSTLRAVTFLVANWFVGLPVPAEPWFSRLPDPPPNVRRFHAQDFHLTVAFLGKVSASQAKLAFEEARVFPRGALDITLGRILPMGSARHFSALSAEVLAGRELVAERIASVRDAACDAASAARDMRPVRPHVTIARPSRKASPEQRKAALTWAKGIDLGAPELRLDRIALYTWSEDRNAQLFQVVNSLALT